MIRINLLATGRQRTTKKKGLSLSFSIPAAQKLTVACSVILIGTALFIGWRYLALSSESKQVDADILSAQQETQRLHSIIGQVQQFEQRKAQLQQRVALIEQLRKEQRGPVHLLDQISRSLPPMMWLTSVMQGSSPAEVTIEGRCTTLTGLSDFVANLESSGYFKRSVEILSTQTETVPAIGGEMIRFTVKGQFQQAGETAPAATAAAAVKRGD
jgi:type IV pilus assembly protein PilN